MTCSKSYKIDTFFNKIELQKVFNKIVAEVGS